VQDTQADGDQSGTSARVEGVRPALDLVAEAVRLRAEAWSARHEIAAALEKIRRDRLERAPRANRGADLGAARSLLCGSVVHCCFFGPL
jgi:hypothetical protein